MYIYIYIILLYGHCKSCKKTYPEEKITKNNFKGDFVLVIR